VLLVLFTGGMLSLFRVLEVRHALSLGEWLFPFALIYLHLTLSPLPWQLVRIRDGSAPRVSGFLVALAFNAVWIAVVLIGAHTVHPRPGPPTHHGWEQGGPPPPQDFRPPNPMVGLLLINLTFATLLGWGLAEKEAVEAREQEMAGLLRQAESKALQNQLEPHVLYNALSSLSELIYEDPLAAEEVITRLADLYRRLTHHGKHDRVSLGDERRLVESYLAMEQMRLGERLRPSWAWPEWADALAVPPFCLQPLVENAIKHGIGPCEGGGELRIACERVAHRIQLRVENTGAPLRKDLNTGVGIGNLRARLALWMGAGGTLELSYTGTWTTALLQWTEGSTP
jgi:signal transduction histidine kinase